MINDEFHSYPKSKFFGEDPYLYSVNPGFVLKIGLRSRLPSFNSSEWILARGLPLPGKKLFPV